MRNPAKDDEDRMTIPEAKRILPLDFADLNMNPRELKFVASYCSNNFDRGEAVRQAGYTVKSKAHGYSLGTDLLGRPTISEAVRRFIEIVINPYKTRLEFEVLEIYYRRANYKVSTFVQTDPNTGAQVLVPLDQIPAEWQCCIDGIEKKSTGGMNPITWNEYKLPNRDTALQTLLKMVALTSDGASDSLLPSAARAKLKDLFETMKTDPTKLKPPTNVTPLKTKEA